MMGIKKIVTVEVSCDFSLHGGYRALPKGTHYHFVDHTVVICDHCWDNLMTIEELLVSINVAYTQRTVPTTEESETHE